jgi:hypothetical protein
MRIVLIDIWEDEEPKTNSPLSVPPACYNPTPPSKLTKIKSQKQTVPCPCLPPVTIPPLLSHTTPCHPQRPSPCLLPAHTRGGSACGRGGVCCCFWRWPSVGRAHAHPDQPWPPPTVTPSPIRRQRMRDWSCDFLG